MITGVTGASILTTGAVVMAVVLVPVKDRMPRLIDRALGHGHDPGRLERRSGRRLATARPNEDPFADVVERLAKSLRLEHVALAVLRHDPRPSTSRDTASPTEHLFGPERCQVVASTGEPGAAVTRIDLEFRGEVVGWLEASSRRGGQLGASELSTLT